MRTWQTAHKMREQRGPLPGERDGCDNERVKRYVAKYSSTLLTAPPRTFRLALRLHMGR